MPRKTNTTTVTDEIRSETEHVMSPEAPEQDAMQKLDIIIGYLHAMDRRDKLRTYGGLVRNVLSLIPLLILLVSTWYFYAYGQEIISKIVGETVKQSTSLSPDSMNIIFDQLQNYLPPSKVPGR